jgi:hypothetical protein
VVRQPSSRTAQDARSTAEKRKQQETEKVAKRTAAAKQRIDESAAAKVERPNRPNAQRSVEKTATTFAEPQLDDAADKRRPHCSRR